MESSHSIITTPCAAICAQMARPVCQ